jgi:hypothetical protein
MEGQFRIRVVKTPAGPAPEEVRRAWVGTELVAVGEYDGPELDFVKLELRDKRRKSIAVPILPALVVLMKKDPLAVAWFRNNLPPFVSTFTFGADEVEVLN